MARHIFPEYDIMSMNIESDGIPYEVTVLKKRENLPRPAGNASRKPPKAKTTAGKGDNKKREKPKPKVCSFIIPGLIAVTTAFLVYFLVNRNRNN